ncbi:MULTISPECIES: hypothetical protein [Pseudomonas]|uniref:Uncharacterized protein n=1 Tax=Pseudomonas kribbensis TaxID=1628086 RepID=A0A4Y8VK76_9PSED|nr:MULTISPECIES: hypothetical protein [Pseudomonas]TFH80882.1 hypothetical protein E4J90_11515 [Pseudomonas kribbensis]
MNDEGVLAFEIRAAKDHPYFEASGTDMFASAMQRLGNEGVQVNKIRGLCIKKELKKGTDLFYSLGR